MNLTAGKSKRFGFGMDVARFRTSAHFALECELAVVADIAYGAGSVDSLHLATESAGAVTPRERFAFTMHW